MGLREQAALDAQAILEDKTSGFAWSFTLTSPQGVAAQLKGFTTDIGQTIDPDTGQAVAGRRASVAVSLRSLPELPVVSADENRKPWLVRFSDAKGVRACWKAIEIIPDRAAGIVVLLLEAYHLAPDVVLAEAEGPSLRQQAVQDSQSILEDTFGFGTPITLTSPAGMTTALTGFATDIGMTIDPETGQSVSGRRASVALPLLALPEIPVVSAESSKKPWLVRFFDVKGVAAAWKAIEVLPDRALGVVVLLLEFYQQTIVNLTSSVLVLPSLLLSGSFLPVVALSGATLALPALQVAGGLAPVVALSGATLALPALQVAGGLAPVVTLSAAAFTLPSLQLSGAAVPDVTLVGGLNLPSLQLGGAFTPEASLGMSALNLPSLQLVGTLTPTVGTLSGALVLPSLQLSGAAVPDVTLVGGLNLPSLQLGGAFKPDAALAASALNLPSLQLGGAFTPTVAALSGALVLPSLQVAGSLAPAAAISGALVLPRLQLAGSVTPTVGTLAGSLTLPSLQLAGALTPTATLAGALVLPSLQLSGSFTVSTSPVGTWLRLAASTPTAGRYDTFANVLVPSNPAVQTVAGRRPSVATSANGLPCASFDGSDYWLLPCVASNNSTSVFGLHVWVKPTNIGARQRLVHMYFGSGGARVIFDIVSNGVVIQATSAYPNGAQFEKTNCLTVNVWQSLWFLIDIGGGPAVSDKLKVWLNGVALTASTFYVLGTGDLSTLASGSGSYQLGASSESDTPGSPLANGTLTGPNWHFVNTAPSAAARDAIRLFEVPT